MRFVIAIASLLLLSAASAEEPDAKEAAAQEAAAIDPVGPPAAYTQSVNRATYYLWYEDGAWHVRTRTEEKSRHFVGAIKVEGGTVTSLTPKRKAPKVGKKGKLKPPKTNDFGTLSRDKKTIGFDFETSGGEDGFDFKVSAPSKAVRFHLVVKGFEHPERVLIGKDGVNPAEAEFMLPAHPGGGEKAAE